ncbi:putative ankyrin repeat protein [Cyphellophora attinorum]|uniref:Putative ankyrin repeat protein n=1 Tax=Cyphellophora attinorum TaxID=1664694 RepID=A0A0N1HKX1_9EURO|nr:putative ankyrin repeat protein [Phialophora attinorum]KPI35032.1 putative ankyrin repeat protein [Phialophora attinorum]
MDAPPPYSALNPNTDPIPEYEDISAERTLQHEAPDRSVSPAERRALDLQQSGFVSAAAYFALHPPSRPAPPGYYVYTVIIDPATKILPAPTPIALFQQSDVDSRNWQTFANHLFPRNWSGGSSRVTTRRSQLHELGSSDQENRKGILPDLSSLIDTMSIDPSKSSQPHAGISRSESPALRALRVEAVLAEWNAGFFEPRGVKLLALFSEDLPSDGDDTPLHKAISRGRTSEVRLLLDHGSQAINSRNRKGETPLYRAVYQRDTSMVEMLLARGADPDARPPHKDSCIYTAVKRDDTSTVTMLLGTNRVGLDEITENGETALYRAVTHFQRRITQLLLDAGASVHVRPTGKNTMLEVAVSQHESDLFKTILEKGADPNERNRNGDTPLSLFLSHGRSMSTSNLAPIVRLLLDRGANPNARNGKGETSLSIAVRNSLPSVVPLLLQRNNLDINAKDSKGNSPLSQAIAQSDKETSIVLLQHGADANATNPSGEHVLYRALCNGNSSLVALLLTYNARTGALGSNGESVLYRAVLRCESAVAALLLSHGADPDATSPKGEPCLWRAVEQGDSTLAALLISHGAAVDAPTPKGETPLYRATVKDNASLVTMLLARGADPNKVGPKGESALDYALRQGNESMLRLFNVFLAQQAASVVEGKS